MSSIKDLLLVGAGVNGSGTANSVMKWLDADTATDSIIYDNGTNIGIGTSSPTNFSGFTTLDINNSTNGSVLNLSLSGTPKFRIVTTATQHEIIGSGSLPLRIGTADAERMRIDSSGNVGIGTSSIGANSALLVNKNTGYLSVLSNVGFGGSNNPSYDNGIHFGFNRSNGNAEANIIYGSPSGFSGHLEIGSWDGSTYSERMRITSGGQVKIGSTIGLGGRIMVMNDATSGVTVFDGSANGNLMLFVNSNAVGIGTITTNGSSTSYNTTSDYRLKENVVPMSGALDRVNALKPSRFNFIADPETTVDGFLAHEVQAIVPEAISGEKDAVDEKGNPIYQGIDQSKLVPLLVGAIQELKAEIETLKSQING